MSASVAQLWALTEAVEDWPTITSTMTRVTRLDDGPLAVGCRVRVKQPGQRTVVWTVTRVDPEDTFAWKARTLGMDVEATHIIRPTASGCTNTLVIDLSGRFAAVLGRVLAPVLRRGLEKENAGFATRAEQGLG